MTKTPGTPCIGVCSSGIGDDVCRGCKRFAHEVINWNAYSDQERALIQQRLDQFLIQIIESKIQIQDARRLFSALRQEGISCDESKAPGHWVYSLLRSRVQQRLNPQVWGIRVRRPYHQLDSVALHTMIDREFYELSQAHYERYIEPGLKGRPNDPSI